MNKENFYEKLREELDLEENELTENSSLHLTSLMQLSLISLLDEHFGLRVKATELNEIRNVSDLISLIGEDKFI
jgi:acyl carrier protein